MKTQPKKILISCGALIGSRVIQFSLLLGYACLATTWKAAATDLESQWKYLPEVRVKPEAGASGVVPASPEGGNKWKENAQSPNTVPVRFSGVFQAAECTVTVTLAGRSVSSDEPLDWQVGPGVPFLETPTNTVYLKPFQTYTIRLAGDMVYQAEAFLEPPDLNNLFSSPTVAKQPARLYRVYWWNKDTRAWEKICGANRPHWNVDSWQAMDETFQVQVRPDLGARPVTKPGGLSIGGEDQADDSWTRDEPSVDATTAPGDGEAVTMGSAKNGDPASVRFSWSAFMGRLWSGAGAGRIRLSEFGFTSNAGAPRILNYAARSSDTNEVMVVTDLDDTNCLIQVKAPQALADVEMLYGSALLITNDLMGISSLVTALTNHANLLSEFLWTNLSSQAQQVLTNTNSSYAQLQGVLFTNFNQIIQGALIYESNRFTGITLSGRTKRLRLKNPQSGEALVRLNRFLLEDAYPTGIARLQSTSFDLNYYIASLVGPLDELGFFTLTNGATPFVKWRMGLPDGNTNQWQLQEIRNGRTNTTLLAYGPSAGVWTLTRGTGNEARVETRTITTNTVSGVTRAVEAQEVKNGAGTISDRTTEVFQAFDWGYELVTVTNDPGGANLITQFNYAADTNSPATYGKIESIIYPDGFWERREYSTFDPYNSWQGELAPFGSMIRLIQPWKDTPTNTAANDCLVTDYSYHIGVPGKYQVQKWHDADGYTESSEYNPNLPRSASAIFVEESYPAIDACATPGLISEERQLGNLEHYGEYHVLSTFGEYYGRLAGHLYSKWNKPFSLDAYDYEFGSWDAEELAFQVSETATNDVRQTIFHGQYMSWAPAYDYFTAGPSGGNIDPVIMEPDSSTMEVRIIHGGNLTAKELYVYRSDFTNFALIERVIYQRDCLGHATNVYRVDPGTEAVRVIYKADWKGTNSWPTDLRLCETDESGTVVTNTYDSLKRLKTATKLPATGQSALVTALMYDAAGRTLTNTLSGGALSLVTVTRYDLAGRLTNEISPVGLSTSYQYANGGRDTTMTGSSGTTSTISKYLDRRVKSITGNAVTNQFFDYSLTSLSQSDALYAKSITTTTFGSSNSLRWTASLTDQRYQPAAEWKPAFGQTNHLYKEYFGNYGAGLPGNVIESGLEADEPSDFRTYFTYDFHGQLFMEQRDGPDMINVADGVLNGTDRTTTQTNFYTQDGSSHWFKVVEQWTYPYDNDPTPTLVERTKERLTGFTATQVSETQKFDADTNQTTVKVTVDLANKKVITTTAVPQSSLTATQIVVNGLLQTESTPTVATPTTHYYDVMGREIRVVDPLGNQTGTRYDATTGQMTATTNALGLVTSMEYYPAGGTNAGLLKCLTNPTGKKTWYNYNGSGQVTHIWGDVPYPEKRDYNQFGDLVTLTTYRGGTQWAGSSWPGDTGPTADMTQWFYDEATGLLTNKTDDAGQAVKFDYYQNYFPKSRIWARGVANTNVYSANGDLVRIDYSTGESVVFTNEVYATYDRMGRPKMVDDATGTNVLTYDHAGRTVSIACTAGLLPGITVSNHFNPAFGRDALSVASSGTPLVLHAFAYDTYGRLSSVANGDFWASYGYKPNSDLLLTTTCKSNTSTILTTSRSWEYGSRLSAIVNEVNGVNISSHGYTYDSLNRRTRAAREDSSFWQYGYNDRNELTGARRYWLDDQPVAGQQFGYDYDNIGNRKTAQSGGDASGLNLRTTGYAANNLNHYTTITNLGYEDILGVALATNAVWVNGGLTERKVEYFRRELSVANGSGPLWTNVIVASGGVTNSGGLILPDDRQALTYDLDGNLTFDGTWIYEWDGENRLKGMTMTNVAGIANANRIRHEFTYDYHGRRVQKVVKAWNGSTFGSAVTNKFVYDGWNLLVILNPQSSILQSFTWGQDLSGTMDEAGGIGGLMLVTRHGSPNTNAFAAYDGNGNVTALVNGESDPIAARYEYSPYGELLRATGPFAHVNPFRWSTKFCDDESELVYYGYRYYSPSPGRWLGRDPLEEEGGLNLYVALLNSPIGHVDPDGRWPRLNPKIGAIFTSLGVMWGASVKGKTAGMALIRYEALRYKIAANNASSVARNRGGNVAAGGAGGGPPKTIHRVTGTPWMLGLVGLLATYSAVEAGANIVLGTRSAAGTGGYALESAMINYARGETAYGDLDAIEAALLTTGGVGSDALVTWEKFESASEEFAEGFNAP